MEQKRGTTHKLRDGTLIRTRLLQPEDREKLRNGFARLSPESRYRRFFSIPSSLSEATLDRLTHTDGVNHVAIGAELAGRGADRSYGIGLARFVRLSESGDTAEAAVAVIDEMQNRGVGRLLLGELIGAAHERGVTTFVCNVLPGNEPIKSLLLEIDDAAKPVFEDGILRYELALPAISTGEQEGPVYRLLRSAAEGVRVILRLVPGVDGDAP